MIEVREEGAYRPYWYIQHSTPSNRVRLVGSRPNRQAPGHYIGALLKANSPSHIPATPFPENCSPRS